jgi:hypothetical protein
VVIEQNPWRRARDMALALAGTRLVRPCGWRSVAKDKVACSGEGEALINEPALVCLAHWRYIDSVGGLRGGGTGTFAARGPDGTWHLVSQLWHPAGGLPTEDDPWGPGHFFTSFVPMPDGRKRIVHRMPTSDERAQMIASGRAALGLGARM